MNSHTLTRRDFLEHTKFGMGGIALASLLGQSCALADGDPDPKLNGGLHHRAKVRRVIQLFMNGGASQCDLFDYKPKLIEHHGKVFNPGNGERVEASISTPGAVMKSPYEWAQHGQSGRWVSSALPHKGRAGVMRTLTPPAPPMLLPAREHAEVRMCLAA